jgi:hypothetical protein
MQDLDRIESLICSAKLFFRIEITAPGARQRSMPEAPETAPPSCFGLLFGFYNYFIKPFFYGIFPRALLTPDR